VSDRRNRVLLIATLLPLCWLGMMVVHELGHVLGAMATGGRVERVVLHPLTISRTDVQPNPAPLAVTWAGPALGVLLPALVLIAWRLARVPEAHIWRFFTGFCLIANGLYIAVGSFDRVGDAGDLLRHGASAWQLWLFGIATVPVGVWLWHGQGKHFGLGKDAHPVSTRTAFTTVTLLALVVILEVVLSPRE
jgi:Peptidase M50B-like